jgi:hypothetical protein
VIRGQPLQRGDPLDHVLYLVMGGSVAAIWVGTLVLTVLLFHVPIADTAVRRALRLGTVISVIGIALGALMVPSTPAQRESPVQQLAGAHSVGVADGGSDMPVTGWSTIGGDLRIPHFVGMHALQGLPLFVMLLGFLARHFPPPTAGRRPRPAGRGRGRGISGPGRPRHLASRARAAVDPPRRPDSRRVRRPRHRDCRRRGPRHSRASHDGEYQPGVEVVGK